MPLENVGKLQKITDAGEPELYLGNKLNFKGNS